MTPLLSVRNLTVQFPRAGGWVKVVDDLSFDVRAGEMLGMVGESGSGKSLTALAVMGLIPPPGRRTSGEIFLQKDLISSWPEKRMRGVRGGQIGIVFQEPMTSLNPVLSVGFQIAEAVRAHRKISRKAAWKEAENLLNLVAIADPGQRLKDYPHQLSGGQRQRVMVAIALAAKPRLLLADEPTTALDVTIQAQILELLERLQRELGLAVVLISHDLAVIAETCERVLVLYSGQLVEEAPVETLFEAAAHPYSQGLLKSLPHLGRPPLDGDLPSIPGQVPEPQNWPAACRFHPRCSKAWERCREESPQVYEVSAENEEGSQRARCFLHTPEPDKATDP